MQLSHTLRSTLVQFDEPNLVSSAGLVPVLGLAQAAGLRGLADEHLTAKVESVIALTAHQL